MSPQASMWLTPVSRQGRQHGHCCRYPLQALPVSMRIPACAILNMHSPVQGYNSHGRNDGNSANGEGLFG